MHIPDGFLDAKTLTATAALAAGGLGVALRHAHRHLPRRRVPLLGLAAAFVFAAQMLNFPVAGGTSGHLVGGVLAAVLLGPSAAVIVLSAVLLVQCFMFADGGVLALGANIFNMGLVATVGGYGVYWATCAMMLGRRRKEPEMLRGAEHASDCGNNVPPVLDYYAPMPPRILDPAELRVRLLAAAFAAWCGTVMASIACAGELALSHTARWTVVFPAMANIHMLIGVGEGLITALVLAAVGKSRPDLFGQGSEEDPRHNYAPLLVYGILIAVGLALFVSPLASKWPDGLEKVAATLGFHAAAVDKPLVPAPMPEYSIAGMHWATAATSIAGAIGTILMFALSMLLARALSRQRR